MTQNEWIAASDQHPSMLGWSDNSEVVLIAKTMKSRPSKLTVSIGWLQRRYASSDEFVWVEACDRSNNILPPNVKYWMRLPEPPKDDDK